MKVETQRVGPDGKPMVDESGNKIMDSEGVWFKNQDEFVIWVNPAFEKWRRTDLRFTPCNSAASSSTVTNRAPSRRRSTQEQVYDLGYLDISLGITYKALKRNSHHGQHVPLALNATLPKATDPHAAGRRRRQGDQTGLSLWYRGPREDLEIRGGSSVEIGFDRTFGKTGYLRITTIFLLRLDYRHRPEEQDQRLHQVA